MPPQREPSCAIDPPAPRVKQNDSIERSDEQQQKKSKRSDSMEAKERDHIVIESRPVVLPDHNVHANPLVFLQDLVQALYGYRPMVRETLKLNDLFAAISDEQIAAYNMTVLNATRNNKLDELKELYFDESQRLDCCNRFGESLLHMACRRGFVDIGTFLLEDKPALSVLIRDDCGRTPMHDICWNPQVELELAVKILKQNVTLLMMSDKRGHAPFDYSRPEHWSAWREFLVEKKDLLAPFGSAKVQKMFEEEKS